MPAPTLETVSEIALFKGLTNSQLQKVRGLMQIMNLPANTHVLTTVQQGDYVYFLIKGSVRIYIPRPDGSGQTLNIMGEGEVLGEMHAIDRLGHSANIITREPSFLVWMDSSAFKQCVQDMPVLSMNVARLLSTRLRLASSQIRAIALDVPYRVARQILASANRYMDEPIDPDKWNEEQSDPDAREKWDAIAASGKNQKAHIPIRLTQDHVADMVGASRVHVNKALMNLKRSGVVAVNTRHEFTVLDVYALLKACNEVPKERRSRKKEDAAENDA